MVGGFVKMFDGVFGCSLWGELCFLDNGDDCVGKDDNVFLLLIGEGVVFNVLELDSLESWWVVNGFLEEVCFG